MARENKTGDYDDEHMFDDPEALDALNDEATAAEIEMDETEALRASTAAEIEMDETEALRAEVADLKDRLLRALADVENIRKRAERDRRDAELYGATRFARDMLSVHDNFERALGNMTEAVREAAPGLAEGIELTQRDLLAAFEKHRINRIEPVAGDRFDPKLHQAMFEAPVPGTKAGDIIQVMGVGFTIGERLLRPAQVGVSSGGPAMPKPNGGGALAD